MNVWNVLEIKPTKDKREIKNAYREKLSLFNPEDDPEGFKTLRSSYDEALVLANQYEVEVDLSDPIEAWLHKFKLVYNDFSKRIDVDVWNKLLNDDIVIGLDTQDIICSKLFQFFMSNYNIPHIVWILIDKAFDIVENKATLIDEFPVDFIDFIINKIQTEDFMDFYLFDGSDFSNIDEFIQLLNETMRGNQEQNSDMVTANIKKLEAFDIYHPFVSVEKIKLLISQKKSDDAAQVANSLYKKYPKVSRVIYAIAEVAWCKDDIDTAITYYKEILEFAPDNYSAILGLADCSLKQEIFKDAKEFYKDLLEINPYDLYARNCFSVANEGVIKKYENTLIEEPDNWDNRIELAWSCFQNSEHKRTLELLEGKEPPKEKLFEYTNLSSRNYLSLEQFDYALVYVNKWIDIIEAIDINDEDEEQQKRRNRRSYAYFVKASILRAIGKYNDALECLDISLAEENIEDKSASLSARAATFLNLEQYEKAIEFADETLEFEYNNYSSFVTKARAYKELRYFGDSIQCLEQCIQLFPYGVHPYIMEMDIFILHKDKDRALDVCKRYKDLEIESDYIKLYEAKFEKNDGNLDKALKMLDDLSKNIIPDDSDIMDIRKIDYEKALILKEQKDYNKALELTKSIITSYNNESSTARFKTDIVDVYILQAELCDELNMGAEKLSAYENVIQIKPTHRYANGLKGVYLKESKNYEEALIWFDKQLEINPYEYYYLVRGNSFTHLARYDEALSDFVLAKEDAPESPYPPYNMGMLYLETGQLDKGYDALLEAVTITKLEKPDWIGTLARCLVRMGKYDEANEWYDKLVNADPSNGYYYKATFYEEVLGEFKEAIKLYKKGLAVDKIDAGLYCNHIAGIYYDFIKNKRLSLKYYKKMLKLDPRSFRHSHIGYYFIQEKNYKKAIAYYKVALTDNPNNASINLNLAQAYDKLGDHEVAVSHVNKAISVYEESLNDFSGKIATTTKLMECYTLLEDEEMVLKYFEMSKTLTPCYNCLFKACHDMWDMLGRYYERVKEYDKALDAFEKALEIRPTSITYQDSINRIQKAKLK